MKAKLRRAAQKIVELERKCRAGENLNENMAALEELTASLSPDEMFAIDEYISENNLLTD